MNNDFKSSVIAISVVGVLLGGSGVYARTKYQDPDRIPPAVRQIANTRYSLGHTLGDDYIGLSVQLPYGVTPTGWLGNQLRSLIFGGERDFGRWLCNNCTIGALEFDIMKRELTQMFTDVINRSVWGDHTLGWKLGDYAEICNGTQCVTAKFAGYTTDPWVPDPLTIRDDNDQGYKNPEGFNVNVRLSPISQWRETTYRTVNPSNGRTVDIIVVDEMPTTGSGSVTPGPLIVVPSSDSYPSGGGMTVYPCTDEFDCPS